MYSNNVPISLLLAAQAQMLELAEEDMDTSKVELDQNQDDPVMKAVLERQYAFRLGMYEHLKGLHQTATDEESWVTQAKVKTRLGVEPDVTPPPWMASIQQIAAATAVPQRRSSRYPAMAMSWIDEGSPLG